MAHGNCQDCTNAVELIVCRDQVVGPEEFLCVRCKVSRIRAKARETIEDIERKESVLLEERNQLTLFDQQRNGTLKADDTPAALLQWEHVEDDEDGDFWLATSAMVVEEEGAGLVYRIQEERKEGLVDHQVVYVLCGDPEVTPEERTEFADLESAKAFCELSEREALADAVRAQISNSDIEPRACRVCGCTDTDCRQCVEKTGEPCSWVEPFLCSACQEAPVEAAE